MKATLSIFRFPKKIWIGIAIALLMGISAIGYYTITSKADATTQEATQQTAVVRRGDLSIIASGTGTLAIFEESELSFTASGSVANVYVQAGDKVKAGTLLAEVDDHEALTEYTLANRNYMELTSPTAISSALEEFAKAQRKFDTSYLNLEYLLSPDVMRWEEEIAKTQQALETAKNQASVIPADEAARNQVKKIEAYLAFASSRLDVARNYYLNEYLFENFVLVSDGRRYLVPPTDTEIYQARLTVEDAKSALDEANLVYEALVSGNIPEGTDNNDLLEIQAAKRKLGDAKAILDGTKIFAPIDGTIMSVEIAAGDSVGTDPVITLANLDKLYLDIYLDESDWGKAATGYEAEVTFDALPDTIFTGKVEKVDSELYNLDNSNAIHGTVLLDIPANPLSLPIGASASVDVFSAHSENALLVPLDALNESDSGEYTVNVVIGDGLEQRTVEIGLQNELYAEVKSGLNDGDIVVTGTQ